jgi:mannose-6-phosphate isomerase-like protein (cupin superfamily)
MATAFQIPTCPETARLADCFALDAGEQPDARRQAERTHRRLAVTFHVTEGVLYLVADGDDQILLPGDQARIPAGTPYRRWNAGDDEAAWVEVYRRS